MSSCFNKNSSINPSNSISTFFFLRDILFSTNLIELMPISISVPKEQKLGEVFYLFTFKMDWQILDIYSKKTVLFC